MSGTFSEPSVRAHEPGWATARRIRSALLITTAAIVGVAALILRAAAQPSPGGQEQRAQRQQQAVAEHTMPLIVAHVLFESPRDDLHCGPTPRSLTSGDVAVMISPRPGAGSGGWVIVAHHGSRREEKLATVCRIEPEDGLRPGAAIWNPAGDELLLSMVKDGEEVRWDRLTLAEPGGPVERARVFENLTEGDMTGRSLYSPCFGADATLYPTEWSASKTGATVVRTQDWPARLPSTEPGGFRLTDRKRGMSYTLFVDGANDLVMCWADGAAPTVCRIETRLAAPLLFVNDGAWQAAKWRPDLEGDLRLPGVPASFASIAVASEDEELEILGRLDMHTVLAWVHGPRGSRLIAVWHVAD